MTKSQDETYPGRTGCTQSVHCRLCAQRRSRGWPGPERPSELSGFQWPQCCHPGGSNSCELHPEWAIQRQSQRDLMCWWQTHNPISKGDKIFLWDAHTALTSTITPPNVVTVIVSSTPLHLDPCLRAQYMTYYMTYPLVLVLVPVLRYCWLEN